MTDLFSSLPPERAAIPALVDLLVWHIETARALGNHRRADALLDRRDALLLAFWGVR